ncbi:hypothetical protein J7K41_03520 [Candidatus Micrarchaeota archaeon]|nr:hypothetical protein [Candidatus Micrarchaeota archaeon]
MKYFHVTMRKGQVSVEFSVIIGLIIAFLIPGLTLVAYQSNVGRTDYALSEANLAVSRLANEVNIVGATGSGSAVYVDVYVPPTFEGFNVTDREIIMSVRTDAGLNDVFRVTDYQLEGEGLGNVKPGINTFLIQSVNRTTVSITRV